MMPDQTTETLLDQAAARRLTDELRKSLTISWNLLVEAYERRAWAALGYESWDAYLDKELGETRLRLPREERREVVASMADAGMSNRAIGSALGVDEKSVRNDRIAGAEKSAPEPEPVSGEIVENRQATTSARHPSANVTAVREWHARQVVAAREAEERGEATRNAVTGRDGKLYSVAQPSRMGGNRRKHLQMLQAMTNALAGLMEAADKITELDNSVTKEEAAQLLRDLSQQIQSLNRIKRALPPDLGHALGVYAAIGSVDADAQLAS